MNLLEELLGRGVHFRERLSGRRYTSALPQELEHERRLVEEAAIEAAEAAAAEGRAGAGYLIQAALRDGRARFEGQICELTGLSQFTVADHLRSLRVRGEVEQVHVGRFRLWSTTCKS